MSARSRLLFAAILSLPGFVVLRAETATAKLGQPVELQLANGDRLTGELLWRADGKIRVRSAILGDLSLNESDVAILELPENSSDHHTQAAPAAVTKPARTQAVTTDAKSPDAPARDVATTPHSPPWKRKLEVGFAQQSGRVESRNHQLRAEAEHTGKEDNLRATARLIYAEQNSRVSADRSEVSLRWRHQLTARAFSQTQTAYYRDDVSNIQFNGEQNIGLGYRFIDRPRHIVNMGSGLTAQYREWTAGRNGVAPYLDFFQDYTFKINDRISFVQDANFQYSPSDRAYSYGNNQKPTLSPDQDNFKMRLNASLHGKITDHLSANLRFEYEQDNAIKLSDASTLQRITSSLGYAF